MFSLGHRERTLIFEARNVEEKMSWVIALEKVLKQLKDTTDSRDSPSAALGGSNESLRVSKEKTSSPAGSRIEAPSDQPVKVAPEKPAGTHSLENSHSRSHSHTVPVAPLETNPVKVKQETAVTATQATDWTCAKCTFINPRTDAECRMCSNPRTDLAKGEWQCSFCSFINSGDNKNSCGVCYTERRRLLAEGGVGLGG